MAAAAPAQAGQGLEDGAEEHDIQLEDGSEDADPAEASDGGSAKGDETTEEDHEGERGAARKAGGRGRGR